MEDQNNKPSNLSNASLDYLNSIRPQPQPEPEPTTTPLFSKKTIIILVAFFAIAIPGLIVLALTSGDKADPILDYKSSNQFSPNSATTPSEIIEEYNINIENPDYSSAIAISNINSNALYYYLDQGDALVYIVDQSGFALPDGRTTNILILYASIPSNSDYIGFIPDDFNPDGTNKDEQLFPEQTMLYLSQSELFDQVTSSTKFYLVKNN